MEKKFTQLKKTLKKNIKKLKTNGKKLIGYGSPAKATTALNFFGISNEIEYIVEDNKLKHGKFLPGMKIPITSKASIKEKFDYALVLAWNFFDEIKKENGDLAHKFISIKDLEIIGIFIPGRNFPCLSLLSSTINSISLEMPKKFNAVVAFAGDP